MNYTESLWSSDQGNISELESLAERIFIDRLSAGALLSSPKSESFGADLICSLSYEWANHWITYRNKHRNPFLKICPKKS